ncbi:hypothetical protein EVAR_39061_1 [Eumeta japonica]|uniref:Secreted protein n=1 Tax=Eumeta variegata TaxID=151549 RepID=A0A4C1WMA2_EUMVA|nr:hypothetical protein EVAR_39061_1 [Eumeta japonica]
MNRKRKPPDAVCAARRPRATECRCTASILLFVLMAVRSDCSACRECGANKWSFHADAGRDISWAASRQRTSPAAPANPLLVTMKFIHALPSNDYNNATKKKRLAPNSRRTLIRRA